MIPQFDKSGLTGKVMKVSCKIKGIIKKLPICAHLCAVYADTLWHVYD